MYGCLFWASLGISCDSERRMLLRVGLCWIWGLKASLRCTQKLVWKGSRKGEGVRYSFPS